MRKPKRKKQTVPFMSEYKISKMNFDTLAYALQEGEVTEKRLRSVYTSLRRKAMRRLKTLSKRAWEFGKEFNEDFLSVRELGSKEALLRELADVNAFLKRKNTTIPGLKKQRKYIMDFYTKRGFNLTTKNYPAFIRFMDWFKNSQYAQLLDSDQQLVAMAFNRAQGATPADWEKAMKEVIAEHGTGNTRKKYTSE